MAIITVQTEIDHDYCQKKKKKVNEKQQIFTFEILELANS